MIAQVLIFVYNFDYKESYGEVKKLSGLSCDCENDNATRWNFPVFCMLLWPLYFFTLAIWVIYDILFTFLLILKNIGLALNCSWAGGPP